MGDLEQGPVNFFISYASADNVIAAALYEELKEIDKKRVHCFLDTQSIDSGVDWDEKLNQELKSADWLICVYTGEQSEFCGYEIGVFAEVNGLSQRSPQSRLVCLHDVQPPLPGVFRAYQNRLIVFPSPLTQSAGAAPFDEAAFYLRTPVAKFFSDVYKYKGLYVPTDASESQRQVQMLARQSNRITEAFKAARGSDILANTPTQLGMEVAVPGLPEVKLTRIPDEAIVGGTYESLGLFGLMPARVGKQLPESTWLALREVSATPSRPKPLWMEQLEKDMVKAATERALDGMEATFAAKDNRIFRTILARHIRYENGNHKFEVMFVQTLPRQFLGKHNTSMMLAGLVLASRFRFAYLEEPDVVAAKFADCLSLEAFEANCWQLRYDLDRLQHEAIEFGLLDPVAFVRAFGEENRGAAEQLMLQSATNRDELLKSLPLPGEHITDATRPGVKAIIGKYLGAVSTVNSSFLAMGVDVYRNEILAQLGHAGPAGW